MTAREKLEANERKIARMTKQRFCEVCGEPLRFSRCQIAHRVEKSKPNLKKYGGDFIHSDTNTALVCDKKFSRCNSAVLVRAPLDIEKLIGEYENERHE